jgi:hypothetical protein
MTFDVEKFAAVLQEELHRRYRLFNGYVPVDSILLATVNAVAEARKQAEAVELPSEEAPCLQGLVSQHDEASGVRQARSGSRYQDGRLGGQQTPCATATGSDTSAGSRAGADTAFSLLRAPSSTPSACARS